MRFGDRIVVGSREDAWYLLGSAITPQTLARFEELAVLVLDEDNPALELESKDRWLANLYGKTHSLSGELREGILESLVLMAIYPTAGATAFNVDFRATVRRILARVLPEKASWKRWATFDRQLGLFAEADPDFLLSRIKADLLSASPEIPRLFEGSEVGFFGSSLHCGLLWALEKMAWNPALLGGVTEVLARLAKVEATLPKNMGNRPSNTLSGIYLWWLPHTNATPGQKIAELRALNRSHPDVGWSLLAGMLPTGGPSFSDPTVMPRWRDWAVGWTRDSVRRRTPEYSRQIVELVIETAAESPEKWSQILDGIFRYSTEINNRVCERLAAIAEKCAEPAGRSVLWRKLRDLISRHEAYPGAPWSFNPELLKALSTIRDRLQPDDPVVLNEWLFNHHPDLPDVDTSKGYEAYWTELESRRLAALQEITSTEGWKRIAKLLDNARDVHIIGWLVGKNELLKRDELAIWNLFDSKSPNERQFAASYIAGSFSSKQFSFLEGLELKSQPPDQAAKAMCCLPFERATWDWIDSHLPRPHQDAYWRLCRGIVRSKSADDVSFAVGKLLEAQRPFTAADILQMAINDTEVDDELAYQVLEAGLSKERNHEKVEQLDAYATQQLIKRLQDRSTDQLPRLTALEWGYLPVLGEFSEVKPATLTNELQTNPAQFVELLKIIYRAANEKPREEPLADFERNQARLARELLEAFDTIPGSDATGAIDENELLEWTTQVRTLAAKVDRLGVADDQIGKLLSRYGQKGDEEWPPLPICRVLESIASEDTFDGFINGLVSERGATTRSPTEGGTAERNLADEYRKTAAQQQSTFPKTANALRRLAEFYDHDAKREDEIAERRRLER